MAFQAIISTFASIISIVGGVVGIISALSKEPVFTRLWQHQPPIQSQPALHPSPSLSTPIESVAPSTRAQGQSRQMVPPSRVKPGLVYGLVSGVLAALILIGSQTLFLQTHSSTPGILALVGLSILSIVAGLLPSRASGSLLSSGIAGSLLGVLSFLAVVFAPGVHAPSDTTLSLYFAVFGVPPFLVSLLFGLLGRHLYKRFRVAAPNAYPLATTKPPRGIGAQQWPPPHSARQVPVQRNCPHCGFSHNPPEARFCNQCGAKLSR